MNMNGKRQRIGEFYNASPSIAKKLVKLAPGEDTRSDWKWFRTVDSDLILGFFPCGLTYESIELDVDRDRRFAKALNLIRDLEITVYA